MSGKILPFRRYPLKLHRTIASITVDMCGKIAQNTGIKQVALSGGVFQNRLLLKLTSSRFKTGGFSGIHAPPGTLQRRRFITGAGSNRQFYKGITYVSGSTGNHHKS
jgi:hypothetical protein